MKIISNTSLKKLGVWLYLKGASEKSIREIARSYAQTFTLNGIYQDQLVKAKNEGSRCIIISAGFLEYLQFVFPDDEVYASELSYENGKVAGLKANMYGKEKVKKLKNIGISSVDSFYTDSFADKPLMEFSKSVFLVKDGFVFKEISSTKSWN